MNRLNFFRTLLASIAAVKAGKVENIVPESAPIVETVVTDLPGIGMQSFSLWVGPGQFGTHDIFRTMLGNEYAEFYVDRPGHAISTHLYRDSRTNQDVQIEIDLIEADDLRTFADKRTQKICSVVPENSGSKTSIYGEI